MGRLEREVIDNISRCSRAASHTEARQLTKELKNAFVALGSATEGNKRAVALLKVGRYRSDRGVAIRGMKGNTRNSSSHSKWMETEVWRH